MKFLSQGKALDTSVNKLFTPNISLTLVEILLKFNFL